MVFHPKTLHQTQPVITESRIFGYDEDDMPWHKVLDIFRATRTLSLRVPNAEG